ncbi:MAG: D-alanyl-D-alanine carboxypeptidase family protein, partial [Pseudomonadota bacterium]
MSKVVEWWSQMRGQSVQRNRAAMVLAVSACLLLLGPGARAEQYVRTTAPHAIILDSATGKVLFEKEARVPIHPASMSKLMTAGVVIDLISRGELSLDTPFHVSERAWRTGGSKMFVLVDTEIRVEDLLKGLLVQSGNDAAIVLAENVAGTEAAFARLMNERAKAWGLEHSRFANATGQTDDKHQMSAIDLAKLAKRLWDDYPDHRYLFGLPSFTWSDIEQRNRNSLLGNFPGADGMKTGYTDEAGWGIVATAERNGVRRFMVIAGLESASNRTQQAARLMELSFQDFDTRTFFAPGDVVTDAKVFGGRSETVPLRIDVPVSFTMHRRALDRATGKVTYKGPVSAPVRQGDQLAVLHVTVPGQGTREFPLYAASTVKGLGVFAKIGIGLRALFT